MVCHTFDLDTLPCELIRVSMKMKWDLSQCIADFTTINIPYTTYVHESKNYLQVWHVDFDK